MVLFAFLGHNAMIPMPGNGCSWVLVSAWARAGNSLPLSGTKALMSLSRCLLCKALTLGMGRKTINAPCINSHLAVCSTVGVDSAVMAAGVVALGLFLLHSEPVSLCSLPAEYAENIGDGKNQEFRESEQKRILDLLENF